MVDKTASTFTPEANPALANKIPIVKTSDTVLYISTIQDILKLIGYVRTGSWYGTPINSIGGGQINLTSGVLRAFPFIVTKGFGIDRIQIDVITGAAGNCIFGIYDSNAALYPNLKIAESTVQSVSAAGLKTTTISATLNSITLYWLVYSTDVTPTVRSINIGAVPTVLGHDGIAGYIQQNVGWTVAKTYDGTLPSSFTPAGTLLIGNVIPLILVRAT